MREQLKMIIDSINQMLRYLGIHPNLDQAIRYLVSTDIQKLGTGKFDIAGEDVFLMIRDAELSKTTSSIFEYHEKYMDIHLMIKGTETSNYGQSVDNSTKSYDEKTDCGSIISNSMQINSIDEQTFIMYFPDEAHQPDNYFSGSEQVIKAVMKVRLK